MEGFDGKRDLERERLELSQRLPGALTGLSTLAYNYRWSWLSGASELFAALDQDTWQQSNGNPVVTVEAARPSRLRELAWDGEYLRRLDEAVRQVQADLARPPRPGIPAAHPVAYLCAEFGIHPSLPIYSGGLGVLAGDTVKTASDLSLPMVAAGLFYGQGYFQQRIELDGSQQEFWLSASLARLPVAMVTGGDGKPLAVEIPLRGRTVHVRIWRADIGRVPLYLLDTNCPENDPIDRWITGRLYVADAETRLAQYAVLGIGAVRALATMGIEPSVFHLNDGHASLSIFERLRSAVAAGASFDAAVDEVRERTVFTTHTPVPAGNEGYDLSTVNAVLADFLASAGIEPSLLYSLARVHPDDASERVSMIPLGLRMSRTVNGVSRRHGRVARAMWKEMWPGCSEEEVPIGSVTNGIHVPTWMSGPMQDLFARHLGADWMKRLREPGFAAHVRTLPNQELWDVRCELRRRFIQMLRPAWVRERLARGEERALIEAGERALRDDILTIGFARRVATYKRLYLLTRDLDRLGRLLSNPDRPVQLVVAGKAHPSDGPAKIVLREVLARRNDPALGSRFIFLENYDLRFAVTMVAGVDLWLNLPRFPLEASGTSGMKVADNGGLNLSVADGWWDEACDDSNGWTIRPVEGPDHEQDDHDAAVLFELLEQQVVPLFYTRASDGIPHGWLERVKASLASLVWSFSSERMLREYEAKIYAPQPPRPAAQAESDFDALPPDAGAIVEQTQA